MKDKTGEMELVIRDYKSQKQKDNTFKRKEADKLVLSNSLVSTFASDPIDPNKIDGSKYQNFFEHMLSEDGRVFRWNKPDLSYYIDRTASRRLSKSKIRKAFNFWGRKTKNLFSFRETNNPKKADIYIKVATASEKNRMGEAGPDVSYKGRTFNILGREVPEYIIHHAQITIASDYFNVENTARYTKLGTDHGFQTLVHELGHVLGLMGHSPNKGDCLYYRADPTARACDVLTPEVNTLSMVYGKPRHLTRGFYQMRRTN
ncbi:MAG: matrixin family metalloprotease [Candidatus Caenarcaniphilales bacterium]|nr:matrixin family metalloprotease [Candidatus Caenarcaniphilales bacterium]